MRVYIGQTRSRRLISELERHGFGEMLVRGNPLPPRRLPFAVDNGAFQDWRRGRDFREQEFVEWMGRVLGVAPQTPDFVVTPDIVAGGEASLQFSLEWAARLRGWIKAPLYLAVQDGMGRDRVENVLRYFKGIFVGGTLGWKVATGAIWVQVAHRAGVPCHVGRVGTFRRVRWAQRIEADSIDSCLPLWSAGNLARFVAAYYRHLDPQSELAVGWASSGPR